ncbi:flavin reductase family protein [Streptomyces sp. E5N91]|uniref:flavin reductase family protein n=1 Tax=Streptomyces sp. E5N91 TaxID=1851996 RepID=UPI000EF59CFA|nr:flavin reductase family protein [Streptomyces sp. E5N91]
MTTFERAAEFDTATFRSVIGHFCSGVTVVTGQTDDGPVGFTCQGFHSLSLEPALIVLLPGRGSTSWPRIAATGSFCVNVLAGDQEEVSNAFAVSGGDKFGGVDWRPSPYGSPMIEGAAAWIHCTVDQVHKGGDHWIVVGAVRDLAANADPDPLLFYRGKYLQAESADPRLGRVAS